MKKILLAIVSLLVLAACNSKQAAAPVSESDNESNEVAIEQETPLLTTIDHYLVNEIGKHYAEGQYCVPAYSIIDMDEHDASDILVWGDFWVFNYNQVGDTLKCVSGGSHPGLMHIQQTETSFEVTAFDQVEDGSGNLPSAKRIFGDKYDAFHAINSNEEQREKVRAGSLSDYVKKHNLSVTMYQDYGWPARELKLQ